MPESLTPTTIALLAAGVVILIAYVWLIVLPAWASYARVWERVAAAFLTLYMLAAVVGAGAGIGFMIVWSYDRWA